MHLRNEFKLATTVRVNLPPSHPIAPLSLKPIQDNNLRRLIQPRRKLSTGSTNARGASLHASYLPGSAYACPGEVLPWPTRELMVAKRHRAWQAFHTQTVDMCQNTLSTAWK